MRELDPRHWRAEIWIALVGLLFIVAFCLIAYTSLANQITGARDDLTDASYKVGKAEQGIAKAEQNIVVHDTILQGMGEELKGLSTNLEQIEADCHKVARENTPKSSPSAKFQHYTFCMSHHGWRPVGWKG